ncbi:MAG: efflux RND transporter periplasmic adaptor subunit [Wenzhouxiangellaceae bacterium]|nr:efflux RND transporter periplasmic adaptor subunit [Wenzhouxiangellaceae bacterium]
MGSVTVAVLLARSGKPPETRERTAAALLVEVVRPEPSSGNFRVGAQGTVTPRIETSLVPEVSGKVVWLDDTLVAGGFFAAGQPLLRIEDSDYRTALAAAQAELAAARATLSDEQARSDAAREDFRRLYGDSRRPNELILRLPQVERARASVQAAEAAVARARRDLERTELSLPFDGMVRSRSVDLGQYVNVGSTLGIAFSTRQAEIRLPLAQDDLAFLDTPAAGPSDRSATLPVTLIAKVAGHEVTREARIVRSEGVVDRATRLTYLVAELDDPYGLNSDAAAIPIGSFVEAIIQGRDSSNLITLPVAALHNRNQVYLANAEDQLEILEVEIVRTTTREVYIRDQLGPDPRVIVTAIPAPIPGLPLNVRELGGNQARLRVLPADELAATTTADGGSAP